MLEELSPPGLPYNRVMKQPDETQARRGRRRPGAQEASHAVVDRTRAYRHLRNPFEPMRVFSDDQVAAIHEAALVILETQGMKVLSDDERVRFAQAGAQVDEASQIVRLDRGLVGASLASAPHDITLHAVDPARHMPMSDRHVVFAPTSGPPNIMSTASGRGALLTATCRRASASSRSWSACSISCIRDTSDARI